MCVCGGGGDGGDATIIVYDKKLDCAHDSNGDPGVSK